MYVNLVGCTVTSLLFVDVTSVGMCLPPSQCSNFECDFLRNQLPYDVAEVLNCEARCCSGDRCNRHESGIHGTENPSRSTFYVRCSEPCSYSRHFVYFK